MVTLDLIESAIDASIWSRGTLVSSRGTLVQKGVALFAGPVVSDCILNP